VEHAQLRLKRLVHVGYRPAQPNASASQIDLHNGEVEHPGERLNLLYVGGICAVLRRELFAAERLLLRMMRQLSAPPHDHSDVDEFMWIDIANLVGSRRKRSFASGQGDPFNSHVLF
jgi:hypothetical protein